MNPSASPETSSLDDRVAGAVTKHQRRLRLLTRVAWTLALVAVTASVLLVFFYFSMYLPKQQQIMQTMGIAADAHPSSARLQEMDLIAIQVQLTRALSLGSMFIACAVGSLALGTLVVLVVMMHTSRATLSQVQSHLAQISAQLQSLRPPPPA